MAISYSGSCYAELLRVVETARPQVALGHRLYSALAQPVASVRGGRTRLFQDVGFFVRNSGPPVQRQAAVHQHYTWRTAPFAAEVASFA